MLLLRVTGVVASVGLVLWLVDTRLLWSRARQISLPVIALAMAVNLARQAFVAWRWRLMNTAGGDLPFKRYFLFILASRPAGLLLPGLLGFDLARGMMIGQGSEESRAEHLVSVLSDRVVGLFSVIVIGMAAALVAPQFPSRLKYVGILAALMTAFVVGLLVSGSPVLYRGLSRLLEALGGVGAKIASVLELWMRIVGFFRRNPGRIARALGACALIHLSWFVIVWILATNLDLGLSFWVITTVTALSWVIQAVPVSWMGLGVNELSFIFLLSFQGVAREEAAALSIHQTVISLLFAIACIPMLAFIGNKQPR